MHRTDYMRRGFLLTHQRFVIDVDLALRTLQGYTELVILPATDTLRQVKINCRQTQILRVRVNDQDAEFKHYDPLTRIVPLNYSQPATKAVHQHPEYKRRLPACTLEGDDGELLIDIPADIAILPEEGRSIQQLSGSLWSTSNKSDMNEPSPIDTATPLPTTPSASTIPIPNFQPMVVRVDFVLTDPDCGACFVLPDSIAAPHRYPHMFTVCRPLPGGTRLWLPCIDSLGDKCTWEMQYVVQQSANSELDEGHTDSLDDHRENGNDNNEQDIDNWKEQEIVVVSSGDLVEQTAHPTDPNKKIFHYQCTIPTSAPLIGFAVGSFETTSLSQYPDTPTSKKSKHFTKEDDSNRTAGQPVSILAFCPPGRADDIVASCGPFMQKAMSFYTKELEYGSYPWGSSYKLVFVEDAWDKVITTAGMTIVSTHLLHPDDVIDQVHDTRRTLAQALACQWFGSYILPKTWPDIWITISLAQYAASLFFRKHLGNNEYRYRLKRDIAQCCQLDVNQPPLFNSKFPYPLDSDDSSFVQLKGPLVLFMLNQRMLKGGTSLGLSKVIPKFVTAAADVGISTQSFLKTCRKASGVEIKSFVDQWIFGAGCPVFRFTYAFNRKKMVVEVNMRQENTNSRGKTAEIEAQDKVHNGTMLSAELSENQSTSNAPSEVPLNEITNLFTGTMTARVHEADGTPYEHVLDIQDKQKKFEVQFNTKYKRIRRNTKRFQARQAAAAAESGDVDPGDELGEHEGDEEKEEWGVVEWGEADEDAASATFEWIRLDSEFEWLCELHFEQPDHMWAFQLARDKDVVAQAEAIEALTRWPSAATSTSLMRTLNDTKCFYRVRMDAAFAMAKCATSQLGWVGLLQLTKTFRRRYGLHGSPDGIDEAMIPRPNDFTNLSEYFVQQSIPKAIATVRDDRGRCPKRAQIFILDLLKYNDNSGNPYSDSYYVASLIAALADAFVPSHIGSSGDLLDMDYEVSDADEVGGSLLGVAIREVERYRTLDSILPSHGNIITSSCLKTLMRYMVARLVPTDIRLFTAYTRYGNFLDVRLMAFDSLFILNGLQNPCIAVYILNQIAADPSPYVRYHLARNLAEVLGLYVAGGNKSFEMNEMDLMVIEEEGLRIRDKYGSDEEAAKKAAEEGLLKVRENLGKREDLISGVWDLLASGSILEHRIQKYLLLFCEILFTPDESGFGFPKLRIRMPLTTVYDDCTTKHTQNTNLYEIPSEIPPLRGLVPAESFAAVSQSNPRLASETSFASQTLHPAFSSSEPSPVLSCTTELQGPTQKSILLPKSQETDASMNPHPSPSASRPVIQLKVPPSSPPPAALPNKSDISIRHKKQQLNFSTPSSVESTPSALTPPTSLGLPSTGLPLVPPPTSNARQAAAQARFSKSSGTQKSRGSPTASPAHPSSSSAIPFTNEHITKCRKVITKMMRHKSAGPFLEPVDPIKLGIPTYVDIIKNPMDLGTIKRRLDKGQYRSKMDFEDDVRLVLNNCYTFNRPGDWVYNEGQALESVFESEWQDAFGESEGVHMTIVESPSRSASGILIGGTSTSNLAKGRMQRGGTDFDKCKKIIKMLLSNPAAFEFLQPVDPIAQGVPTYFDIVEHPMDLGTINTKLRNEEYATPEEFRHDVLMVSRNCKQFNPPGTYVVQQVEIIQNTFEKEWKSQFVREAKSDKKITADISRAQNPAPTAKSVNGNSKSALKAIESVLRKLRSHPSHGIFAVPVDRSVPQYYDIVKQPMDLGTIERNLRQGKYRTRQEAESDVGLVFSNCFTFNRPGDPVYNMGKDLQSMWEKACAKAGLGLETAVPLHLAESEQQPLYEPLEGKRARDEDDGDGEDEVKRKRRKKEREKEKKENQKNDLEDRIGNHGNGLSFLSGAAEATSPRSTPLSAPRKLKIKLKTLATNPGG